MNTKSMSNMKHIKIAIFVMAANLLSTNRDCCKIGNGSDIFIKILKESIQHWLHWQQKRIKTYEYKDSGG